MIIKTYYLGVRNLATAFDAIDSLSFCKVIDRQTGQIEVVNIDRIKPYIMPVAGKGAIVYFIGSFNSKEMTEIEGLTKFEDKSLRNEVAKVAAATAHDLHKNGASMIHHILGDTASTADKRWWHFWK